MNYIHSSEVKLKDLLFSSIWKQLRGFLCNVGIHRQVKQPEGSTVAHCLGGISCLYCPRWWNYPNHTLEDMITILSNRISMNINEQVYTLFVKRYREEEDSYGNKDQKKKRSKNTLV